MNVINSSRVIVDNLHRGSNATMWSEAQFCKNLAWFEVDLKEHRIVPTHYTYRGDSGGSDHHPRTWHLLGSVDGEK